MKIDIHTHILPKDWPNLAKKYGYTGGWLEIRHDENVTNHTASLYKDDGSFFRKIDSNCWDLSTRLEEMKATEVDIQVLSTVPVMFNYWAKPEDTLNLCQFLNNNIADSVEKYPNKFIGLGTIPLQEPELCVEELKRIKSLPGIYGVEIGTHVGDQDFDSSHFEPIFKTCSDIDLPIFVHPWDMLMNERNKKFWLPWLVGMPCETTTSILCLLMGGVLLRHPTLKICFAHGGGSYPFTQGRINHGYNVRPDLCATKCSQSPSTFKGQFYTDSLVHSTESMEFLAKIISPDKICLGSDYPFPLGEHLPGSVIENSNLLSCDKEKVLWKNAVELFNLPDHYLIQDDCL